MKQTIIILIVINILEYLSNKLDFFLVILIKDIFLMFFIHSGSIIFNNIIPIIYLFIVTN